MLVVSQKENWSWELQLKLYKEKAWQIVGTLVAANLLTMLFTNMFNQDKIMLIKTFQKNQVLKSEYKNILNNLDQGVITDTSNGFKFMNSKGFELIRNQISNDSG